MLGPVNFIPFHNRMRAYETYVAEEPKREALKRLHERIDAGESVYDILKMDKTCTPYIEKIVNGLCPLSYALYGRIMNLDEEDVFDV